MNNENAKNFIKSVFKNVWIDSNIEAFEKYYCKKVEGFFNGEPVMREDMIAHFNFIKENLSEKKFLLQYLITEDNKIAFRFYYYALKNHSEELHMHASVIYYLENNKIIKVWAFSNLPIER